MNDNMLFNFQAPLVQSPFEFDPKTPYIIDEVVTSTGKIPKIATELTNRDEFGAIKVRLGIGRMTYTVDPGLYAVGNPDENALVLVTANYKLTFDTVRKNLAGMNLWLLVLDTKGVNVWCAAGKGTFGTVELLNRMAKTRLSDVVKHRTIILPQLGAPGISAHDITKQTGFKVVYGPVRAEDVKAFIAADLQATPAMRTVQFITADRFKLTPLELMYAIKLLPLIFSAMFLLNLINARPFGATEVYSYLGALISGCVLTPILLPWVPGKAFSFKGWQVGLLWTGFVLYMNQWTHSTTISLWQGIGYLLILPSVSAYYAMNFTGSSTYTSLSGVMKEMRLAVPPIAVSISIGTIIIVLSSFLNF